jgi:hypothetical protein
MGRTNGKPNAIKITEILSIQNLQKRPFNLKLKTTS